MSIKWALLKMFPKSEVKGQGHRKTKCTFAAETSFRRYGRVVALRLTCLD